MPNFPKTDRFIDSLGLASIGFICFGYIVLGRPFAELHIQLSFLDFPIFIGEILLFLCLCLFLVKNKYHWTKINQRQMWFVAYFTFVIMKALYGYSQWGPLAFRDAALFYYPIFIMFGYSFYRKDFFTVKRTVSLSLLIIVMFFVRVYDDYWTLACFILAFILVCSLRTQWLKYILLAILVLVTPYKFLFQTSRMMMLANSIAMAYLMVAFYLILKIKRELKVAIFVLSAFLVIGGAMKFMDRNAARSIIGFEKIKEAFDAYNVDVLKALGRYDAAHPKEFQGVAVYNPNQPIFFNLYNPKKMQAELPGTPASSASTAVSEPSTVAPGASTAVSKPSTVESPALTAVSEPATVAPGASTAASGLAPAQSSSQQTAVKLYNPNAFPFLKAHEDVARSVSMSVETGVMEKGPSGRDFDGAVVNALFRIFIWRDMLTELIREKPVLGFNFGKPLRSISVETLHWGESEWRRDGWIGAHNSYLDMIYRAGIVGLALILAAFIVLWAMIKKSVQCRSVIGILLCATIINWFIAANFLLILELPYTAIPIWTLFGMTYAYVQSLERHFAPKAKCGT